MTHTLWPPRRAGCSFLSLVLLVLVPQSHGLAVADAVLDDGVLAVEYIDETAGGGFQGRRGCRSAGCSCRCRGWFPPQIIEGARATVDAADAAFADAVTQLPWEGIARLTAVLTRLMPYAYQVQEAHHAAHHSASSSGHAGHAGAVGITKATEASSAA